MKKKLLIALAALLLPFAFTAGISASSEISPGDIVFAEWQVNGWYHGTVGDLCEEDSFMIFFDDGDTKCCPSSIIVKDVIPPKTSVLPGKRVLAQWSDGRYYPGTVSVISGDTFNINFDDGDKGKVTLSQIRLRD